MSINVEEVVKAGRALFLDFCEEQCVTVSQRRNCPAGHFYAWFQAQMNLTTPPAIAERFDIAMESAECLHSLAEHAYGFAEIWPAVLLGDATCRNPLRWVSFNIIFNFQDGVTCALTQVAQATENPKPLTDVTVMQLLSTKPAELLEKIGRQGMDSFHDKYTMLKDIFTPALLDKVTTMLNRSQEPVTPEDLTKISYMLGFVRTMFQCHHGGDNTIVTAPASKGGFA